MARSRMSAQSACGSSAITAASALQRMRVGDGNMNTLMQARVVFQRIPGARQFLAQFLLALQPGQRDVCLHTDARASHVAFAILFGEAEIRDHANIGRCQRPADTQDVGPVQGDLLVQFVIGGSGNRVVGNAQLRALAHRECMTAGGKARPVRRACAISCSEDPRSAGKR